MSLYGSEGRGKRRAVPRRVALGPPRGAPVDAVGESTSVRGDDAFLIFTHSDPDAAYLVDYLRDKGFLAFSDDLSESAMVLVTDTTKTKLLRAIGRSGLEYRDWDMAQVGGPRGIQAGVTRALKSTR